MSTTIVVSIVAVKKFDDPHVIDARVTPEVLDLTSRDGPVTIQFRVATAGYQFPTDGPAIEFTSPGSGSSFTDIVVAPDYRSATVNNINQSGLAYSYLVHVVESATQLRTSVDPIIQNQNG
jgi:hypothetical protein